MLVLRCLTQKLYRLYVLYMGLLLHHNSNFMTPDCHTKNTNNLMSCLPTYTVRYMLRQNLIKRTVKYLTENLYCWLQIFESVIQRMTVQLPLFNCLCSIASFYLMSRTFISVILKGTSRMYRYTGFKLKTLTKF